jgi:heptosyltransferase-2
MKSKSLLIQEIMNPEVSVKNILFITLSNIGDVILTLPVLDYLKSRFPQSKITVLVGPRPKGIFKGDSYVHKLIVYDKHSSLKEKLNLFNELKKENFDMVVDLRNSFLGTIIPAKHKTSSFLTIPKAITHMKDRHLYKVARSPACRLPDGSQGRQEEKVKSEIQRSFLHKKAVDEKYIEDILEKNNIGSEDKIVVVSAGARSHTKRWPKEKFVELISKLIEEFKAKIILTGDEGDTLINKYITERLQNAVIDLSAKTDLGQLACLLGRAGLVITNDSAMLHLASYLDVPVTAIFGPTSELKYGPWSGKSSLVKKDIFCRPCEKAQCRYGTLECMQIINVEDVLTAVRKILVTSHTMPARPAGGPAGRQESQVTSQASNYKRILVARTDRIGDVVISTPVIKALRDSYPHAFIAMMVGPQARDIINGNPYLDEAIIYDKEGRHKGWLNSVKFSLNLKKKRFDLAIILHPTNRVHLLTFLSGIPQRLGYNRKLGFLLTEAVKHTKQLGEKHELEYNFDLLRRIGVECIDRSLFVPIKPESEQWLENLLSEEGIGKSDNILIVHPGASCISKIWPAERFAQAADRLADKYGFKIFIIAGPKDMKSTFLMAQSMRHIAVNLGGKVSLSQLVSLLKRSSLFISNDSGPVHIASSVGVPVISIFGRKQKGLSPKRWGPVGANTRTLHKDVGCARCLAHNCLKGFACLEAISVEDVVSAADSILKTPTPREA